MTLLALRFILGVGCAKVLLHRIQARSAVVDEAKAAPVTEFFLLDFYRGVWIDRAIPSGFVVAPVFNRGEPGCLRSRDLLLEQGDGESDGLGNEIFKSCELATAFVRMDEVEGIGFQVCLRSIDGESAFGRR